jgi:hypothetical protein
MLDRVQLPQPAPDRRRLLARLCLLAFCGGLLPLLSSQPAEVAERRKPGLLDPVASALAPVTGPVAGLVTPVVPEGPLPRGPTVSRRSRQLARHPVHPILAGPDRRGEPAWLPDVGRAPPRAGRTPSRPPRAPGSAWPPRRRAGLPRPAGPRTRPPGAGSCPGWPRPTSPSGPGAPGPGPPRPPRPRSAHAPGRPRPTPAPGWTPTPRPPSPGPAAPACSTCERWSPARPRPAARGRPDLRIPGTSGLIPGAGDPITTSAPLRPVVSASGALPFTGAASDLLALAAGGLLAAGVLVARATRLATAATKGGDDR